MPTAAMQTRATEFPNPLTELLELSVQFEQLEGSPATDFCDLFASLHHHSVEVDAQLKALLEHSELPSLERRWLKVR